MLNGFGTAADERARRAAMDELRAMDSTHALVGGASRTTQQALDIGQIVEQRHVAGHNVPEHHAGQSTLAGCEGHQVQCDVAAARSQSTDLLLSARGFDTHQNQVNTQANLLTQVGNAIKAFYDATVELGLDGQVTTFTLSDFGRTLQPAGSGAAVGSDHAWGNHHFVVGGGARRRFLRRRR